MRACMAGLLLAGWQWPLQADEMMPKPGLWEITQKTNLDGQQLPDMQEMMAMVPPDMRAQAQAMMSEHGVHQTARGVTVCVTAEQLKRGDFGSDPKSGCRAGKMQRSGNRMVVTTHCDNPKGDGQTEVTLVDPAHWTSVTRMTIEQGGSTHDIATEAAGRWLSTSCAVKSGG